MAPAPHIPLGRFEIFCEGLDHPEGLAFDGDGSLWAGGELGQLYRADRRGRVKEVATLGGFNLGLTFSPKGELWVCNLKLRALLRVDRRGRRLSAIEQVGLRRLRTPNFSVFDRAGNLYFSDSGDWNETNGWIYVVRPNGRVQAFAGALAFPNGLALSADDNTLFVAQSTKDNVLAIEVRPDGTAGQRSVYAHGLARVPDGLVLDARGNLLVTCYASDAIYKVTPGGRVSLWAHDPQGTMIARPTNAAFGGPDRDWLYVANLGRWHICRVKTGTKGLPLVNHR